MTTLKTKSRIVIIGANFAGLSAASKIDKHHDVVIIDSREYFQWTPNIHEILSDVKKETSLNLPLATIIARLGHQFINQTVESVDGELKKVTLNDQQTLYFDVLLIASGHCRSNYGIKGADEHAYGFRKTADVVNINQQIEKSLNKPIDEVNISIVGGGFTGVEVLGELLRKYAKNSHFNFRIIDSSSRLLQSLPTRLSADVSADVIAQCKPHCVSFHFNKFISEVKSSSIEFDDGTAIKSDLTIWTAGTKLPDYLNDLNTRNLANGLAVNRSLQTETFDNIFVAGDSASLPNPVAKQASNAMDMGLHAAENINRLCANKTLQPFKQSTKPILLSLGDLNTYLIQKNLVLASPLLAAAKEAVYQLYMARFSALLPVDQGLLGIAGRISQSTEKLLLTEILKARPKVLLGRSKILY